jgi:predicted nucleotidyltransferase
VSSGASGSGQSSSGASSRSGSGSGSGFGSGGHDPGLTETAKRVGVALKQADIPFALGGGCASYVRGGPGSEHDVDFFVCAQDVETILDLLSRQGLRVVRPPEDWLVKVYDDAVLVDLIHQAAGRPVTREMLSRAEVLEVGSVRMPVLATTDLVIHKMSSFGPHACDFARPLAMVRALREQVDWDRVRAQTKGNDYAYAFLVLAGRLGLLPEDQR